MKQILICAACNLPLTIPLIVFKEADGMRKKNKSGWMKIPPPDGSEFPSIIPKFEAGQPVTPKGTALERIEPYFHRDVPGLKFIVRLDDLTENIIINQNWEMACCGTLAGDKANRSCRCGAEIGFEDSECYTEHWLLPDMRKTKWQNVKS